MEKLNFKRLIQDTTTIDLGHLAQERQNLQSTKHLSPILLQDMAPVPDSPNVHSHNVMSMLVPFSAKELSYGDITGIFPYKSSRGNQYIYVSYDYDSNSILVEAMSHEKLPSTRNCNNIVKII